VGGGGQNQEREAAAGGWKLTVIGECSSTLVAEEISVHVVNDVRERQEEGEEEENGKLHVEA
jgi:UDP-N-acetylenolpyruvoylglucosamine reductase